ncbi:MAG TPA: hypothetical protein VD886_16540, partial [Herpetosiphonaceae bacterium]|nr:hypothetical protein [Herpetosiphonaceae bacterium]
RSERPSAQDAERAASFAAALDPLTYGRIEWASAWAARQGWGLYAVGGFVRDMMLGRQPGDLDVVVEGDAIAVAQALVAEAGGVIHAHSQFGTATVEWQPSAGEAHPEPSASHLDFITARTEFYEHPTALPEVAAASLRHDLHRRDFTINTLALDLAPGRRGHLYDFYGGMRDLERRLIRVLHNLSFIDDPTRLLRALRLAARLGFAIEARTGELIHDAVAQNVLHRTTPARIRHELRLLFEEDFAAQTLASLAEWGILAAIHPGLRWSDRLAEQFEQVLSLERGFRRTARLLLLLDQLPAATRQELAARYALPKAERERIGQWAALEELGPQLAAGGLGAGTLDRLLAPYAEDSLRTFAIAAGGRVARRIERYLAVLRHIPSRTTGRDLIAQGLPPGPGYRERLTAAREDQLNREADGEE